VNFYPVHFEQPLPTPGRRSSLFANTTRTLRTRVAHGRRKTILERAPRPRKYFRNFVPDRTSGGTPAVSAAVEIRGRIDGTRAFSNAVNARAPTKRRGECPRAISASRQPPSWSVPLAFPFGQCPRIRSENGKIRYSNDGGRRGVWVSAKRCARCSPGRWRLEFYSSNNVQLFSESRDRRRTPKAARSLSERHT